MTEEEWLGSMDPFVLESHLRTIPCDRKKSLLACVACEWMIPQFGSWQRNRIFLNSVESYHDGIIGANVVTESYQWMCFESGAKWHGPGDPIYAMLSALHAVWAERSLEAVFREGIRACGEVAVSAALEENVRTRSYWFWTREPNLSRDKVSSIEEKAASRERQRLTTLTRDIFGNPFRPISFSPEWRTTTAVAIAQGMYESRDFGPVPLLADSLQDAGCEVPQIIDHCRGPGPHVRGCWVVDGVLGKS